MYGISNAVVRDSSENIFLGGKHFSAKSQGSVKSGHQSGIKKSGYTIFKNNSVCALRPYLSPISLFDNHFLAKLPPPLEDLQIL